jgi:hypothetical protein
MIQIYMAYYVRSTTVSINTPDQVKFWKILCGKVISLGWCRRGANLIGAPWGKFWNLSSLDRQKIAFPRFFFAFFEAQTLSVHAIKIWNFIRRSSFPNGKK